MYNRAQYIIEQPMQYNPDHVTFVVCAHLSIINVHRKLYTQVQIFFLNKVYPTISNKHQDLSSVTVNFPRMPKLYIQGPFDRPTRG